MTGSMFPMKHSVGKPVDRACAGSVRTDNRCVDCDKNFLRAVQRGLQTADQFVVALWIPKSSDACTRTTGFEKTDPVRFLVSPGEVNTNDECPCACILTLPLHLIP